MRKSVFSASLAVVGLLIAACASSAAVPTGTPRPIPEELRLTLESSGPPGVVANQPGGNSGDAPFLSPPDGAGGPGQAAASDPITDFSTLEAGMSVYVTGTLSTSEESFSLGLALLTDENGNTIKVTLPPPVIQQYNGTVYTANGTLVEDPAEAGSLILQVGSSTPGSSGPPFAQADTPPFMQNRESAPVAPDRTITLEANLSALEAYDSLLAAEAETLADYGLVSIVGAPEVTWTIQFKSNDGAAGFSYTVNNDGLVERLPANIDGLVIDRDTLVVDSPAAAAYFEENGATAGGVILMELAADDSGDVFWTALEGDVPPLDATTPQ